jgi:peptide/nickel transport system permease protein
MLLYILRRILLFIPSLFFITLIAFLINSSTPGDPVMRLIGAENDRQTNAVAYESRYREIQHQLGLDLPLFYFSLTNLSAPDSLFLIQNASYRKVIIQLSAQTGDGSRVLQYYKTANAFLKKHSATPQVDAVRKALLTSSAVEVSEIYKYNVSNEQSAGFDDYNKVLASWNDVIQNQSSWRQYIPIIKYHSRNQYHRWIFGDENVTSSSCRGILQGDFGNSLVNGKPVVRILREKTGWTLFFTLGGIIISLLIAIPMGINAARKNNSAFDRRGSGLLILLHSLPSFFTATVLLMVFANPSVLGWFPASGAGPVDDDSVGIMQWIKNHIPYFVLPLISYSLASLPFIMRAVRASMIDELDKDYIVTARAKGLNEFDVVWKHAFRNSLFPLITLVAWLFPAMIGGSAILETVFSIPGMGLEIVQAISSRDYPLIIAIFTFTGLLTVTGYLVSDILYAFADPRVQLN